jgi:hypothetical protein
MRCRVSTAEGVSDTLLKMLPQSDATVDHYRSHAEWALAIVETLAIIAKSGKSGEPMLAAIAGDVRALFEGEGVNPNFRRAAEMYLSRIPTE